ncbi:MAG TPA: DUF6702 family protein [Chitinophaga sp.]|uniref:DUF6702 family protein n=1 Tax=Chitinophaga sp. TaxID=1869181 RepID=UPI002C1583F6|nr:DUF6702 family protein [Chitinophaga sp.]HVI47614.1 DUF6702 family protein [Chitinophaga sp.]
MGLLLCKWWMTVWLAVLHPFYASVTEITHDAARKELQVSCRIFTDDLENTLKQQFKTPIDLTKPANRKQVEEYINAYLLQHLQITLDGKKANLHLIGYKIEEDAVWSFLEADNIPTPGTVAVRNDVLYAQHPTQINMIHVIVGGQRKSAKLDNPKADVVMRF